MTDSNADGVVRPGRGAAPPNSPASTLPLSPALTGLMVRMLGCDSFDELPSSIITPLGRAIGASSGVFMQFLGLPLDGDTIGRSIGIDDNVRRATDTYADGLYTVDPMVRPALDWLRSGDSRSNRTIGLLSEVPGWRDEVIYRRFLERFRIGDVLAVAVPTTTVLGPEVMCLGFHRQSDSEPFTQNDRLRVQSLLPALEAVLRNLAHRDALIFSSHVIDELGDAGDGTNLLVLDQDLRIRHANRRALRRLANQRAGGGVEVDILGALRKQLLDSPPLVGERRRIGLPGRSVQTAPARAIHVEMATFRMTDGRFYYLVTEVDEPAVVRPDVARRHGLTDREREVAHLVCLGHNSTVVARELGIARRTVENHLRSVYAKVGVNSRTQLAARWLHDDSAGAARRYQAPAAPGERHSSMAMPNDSSESKCTTSSSRPGPKPYADHDS